MIALAEHHRRKIKAYNTIKTGRADSMKFLIILIAAYIVSNIIPGEHYDSLTKQRHTFCSEYDIAENAIF